MDSFQDQDEDKIKDLEDKLASNRIRCYIYVLTMNEDKIAKRS